MKILIGFIFFLDFVFLAGCFMLPRSGMEAMGSVFVLTPLAGLHLLAGITACIIELRKKRWKFPVYFMVATCLMVTMWYLYGKLKPTYRPLHRVLITEGRKFGNRIVDFKDNRVLKARRILEEWRDEDHADLCLALEYPIDVDELSVILRKKPDLAAPCAQLQGRETLPMMAVIAEGFEPWSREKMADREPRLADIRTAVDLLMKSGADPNSRDEKGNTPLHWSLWYKDEAMVHLLIYYGGCVYLKNNEGQSVMKSYPYSGIGKIIRKAAENPQMTLNCSEIFQKVSNGNGGKAEGDQQVWTKELFYGVKSGRIDSVTTSISKGIDSNVRDRKGMSPLHLATTCRKEMPAIVEILVTAGGDVNSRDKKGVTPLMGAVRNHCPDIVAILLEKGADPTLADRDGATAMHWMARWQAEKMTATIDNLLAAGAEIDARDKLGRSPLMMTVHSVKTGDDAMTVFLAKGADPDAADMAGNNLIHLLSSDSSKKERVNGVFRLIEAGAAIDLRNRNQMTPLMLAVKHRKAEIAKLLLEAGASADVVNRRGTPLLHTIISCQPEKLTILDILIGAGSDVNVRNDSQQTALHRAMLNHLHVKCLTPIEKLLSAGSTPNIRDKNGTAPLHNLAQWEQKNPAEALSLMKRFGADIDIRDHQGLTTLLRSARFGTNTGVMKALLDAGADPSVVDNRGNNLLHCITMNSKPGSSERLQIALTSIKNLNVRNQSGRTALELARKHGNENLARELIKAGAEKKSE